MKLVDILAHRPLYGKAERHVRIGMEWEDDIECFVYDTCILPAQGTYIGAAGVMVPPKSVFDFMYSQNGKPPSSVKFKDGSTKLIRKLVDDDTTMLYIGTLGEDEFVVATYIETDQEG